MNLKTSPAVNGVSGLCLDPHDLAIAKLYARREKDVIFVCGMISHGVLDRERLMDLARATKLKDTDLERMLSNIEQDFAFVLQLPAPTN